VSQDGQRNDADHSNPGRLKQSADKEIQGQKSDEHKGHDRGQNSSPAVFGGVPFNGVPFNYAYPYGSGYYYGNNVAGHPDIRSDRKSANPYDLGYSDGFKAGGYDHLNGFIYNPRQYERSGNSDYFEGFVSGYRDGWSH
jgi:hypothetical protein